MTDDIPGDYSTVGGIKQRARALGNDEVTELLERIEDRVYRDDAGWVLENPPEDASEAEFFGTLAVLFGAALEREYPAEVDA